MHLLFTDASSIIKSIKKIHAQHVDLTPDNSHVRRYTGRLFSWGNNLQEKINNLSDLPGRSRSYQIEASEKMTAVSDSKIEKFEYEMQEPTPYDIIQMADAYGRPDLCNYYCSHKCEIGHRYVPEVEVSDLSNIILETIASLNEINPLTTRLIQIARDGKISDDEMKDFAYISKKLDEISLAIDSLNLWVDKTAGEQRLNLKLLNAEKEKIKIILFLLLFHYECDVTNAIIPPTINNGKAMYSSPPITIPINITGKKITVQSSFIIPQDALNPKTKKFSYKPNHTNCK